MAQIAPTTTQIRAHVQRLRKNPKLSRELAVGIHSTAKWSGGDSFTVEGQPYEIAWCTGPLQVRHLLTEHDASGRGLVIVTPLDERDLGADVLARLARSRLETIRAWDMLMEQFQAKQVDPQVSAHRWIADALLSLVPEGGFAAVPAGVLDAQTVWEVLLTHKLGIVQHPVDLESMLAWTQNAEALQKYADLEDDFRKALREYLIGACGLAAAAILDCIDAGHGCEAVALGLVCRVIFHQSGGDKPAFEAGAVRLEKYMMDHPLAADTARSWATAAEILVRKIQRSDGINAARPILASADQLLADLRGQALALLSDVLPAGFERRLTEYAGRLSSWLQSRSEADREALAMAAFSACRHDQACYQADRVRRVEMSLRLATYIDRAAAADDQPAPFDQLALNYAHEGGFVDWARAVLAGEGSAELADAFAKLSAVITERREIQNRQFAQALVNWSAAGSQPREVVAIESVLDQVVVPLAQQGPVLLLVIDGMSFAVFRELLEDLVVRQGWAQLADERLSNGQPAVATIPSVTELSRTSLLCGKLSKGGQSEASAGFTSHAGLLSVSRSGGAPLLFHKAELSESGGQDLAADLRRAIGSNRRVIGVVINAVDDYLLKGDQVQPRWTLEYIRVLRPLLHEAGVAGQAMVLVSDHGHVIGRQSEGREAAGGERWREATSTPEAGEMLVSGPRVLAGGGKLIGLWSEKIHFGVKKNGYHGGLSPQEMLAPLAVLAPATGKRPDGWKELGLYTPAWWEFQRPETQQPVQPLQIVTPPPKEIPTTLFEVPPVLQVSPPEPKTPEWIPELLASPVFEAQKKLAGRIPVANAMLCDILAALASRGGTMLRPALARQLNLPPLRLPGVIAGVRRLLNVDGVDVLSIDEASDSIVLDVERLKLQFDLN